jgi:hypothetical protein
MTVARLRREMPNAEFVRWQAIYAREAQLSEVESRR